MKMHAPTLATTIVLVHIFLATAPLRADFILAQDAQATVSDEVRNANGQTEGGPTTVFHLTYPSSVTASGSLFAPTYGGALGEGGTVDYDVTIANNAARNQGTADIGLGLTMVGAGSMGVSTQHTFVYSIDRDTYYSNPEVVASVDFSFSGQIAVGGSASIDISWGDGSLPIYGYHQTISQSGSFSLGDLQTIYLGRAEDVLSFLQTEEQFSINITLNNPLGGTSFANFDPGFGNFFPQAAVPEPSSLLLVGIGIAGLSGHLRVQGRKVVRSR